MEIQGVKSRYTKTKSKITKLLGNNNSNNNNINNNNNNNSNNNRI